MRPPPALLTVARGFCMGAADVVPGVSGGTMALILGIYGRLIHAIRSFDLPLVRLVLGGRVGDAARHVDLAFLVLLGGGIFSALLFFTRVVPLPRLIVTNPEPIYGLFFGLIVASAWLLLRSPSGPTAGDLGWVAAGAAIGFGVVNLVPFETPDEWWFVCLSGAVAITAMILPGLSGSFLLLLLRKYAYVFDAIGRLDLAVLVPFAVGAAAGLLAFSRVLNWLIHRHFRPTVKAITGLLLGSLWVVWPFQDRTFEVVRGKERLVHSTPAWPGSLDAGVLLAFGMMLVGVVLVLGLAALAGRGGTAGGAPDRAA